MVDGVPIGWVQIGAGGLVTLFVLMLWNDRILTKARHLEVVNMLKDRITEGDRRLARVEKERDDALSLAQTAVETSNIQARTKDASLAAVEAVHAEAKQAGGGET